MPVKIRYIESIGDYEEFKSTARYSTFQALYPAPHKVKERFSEISNNWWHWHWEHAR